MHTLSSRTRRFLAITAAVVLTLAACSDEDEAATDTAQTTCALAAQNCADIGEADAAADATANEDAQTGADTSDESDTTATDAGATAVDAGPDTALPDVAGDTAEPPPEMLTATESHEAEILYGWLAAGQPSEARLAEVVAEGAVIISLRLESEDPFDEPALVDSLGGTFIRYGVASGAYDDPAFREAMYDLYDEHRLTGQLVYLHCASSNRVGASWALYQAERLGVPAEDAIEMGQAAGLTSLESMVRGILGV